VIFHEGSQAFSGWSRADVDVASADFAILTRRAVTEATSLSVAS